MPLALMTPRSSTAVWTPGVLPLVLVGIPDSRCVVGAAGAYVRVWGCVSGVFVGMQVCALMCFWACYVHSNIHKSKHLRSHRTFTHTHTHTHAHIHTPTNGHTPTPTRPPPIYSTPPLNMHIQLFLQSRGDSGFRSGGGGSWFRDSQCHTCGPAQRMLLPQV